MGLSGFRVSLKPAPGFFSKLPSFCHLLVLFHKHTPVTHWGGYKGSRRGGSHEVSQVTRDWAIQEGAKAKQILLIISPSAPGNSPISAWKQSGLEVKHVLLWTGFVCLSPLFYSVFTLTLPYGSLPRRLPGDNEGTVFLKDTIKLVDSKQFPGDNQGTASLRITIHLADCVEVLCPSSSFWIPCVRVELRAFNIFPLPSLNYYSLSSIIKLLLIESEAHW